LTSIRKKRINVKDVVEPRAWRTVRLYALIALSGNFAPDPCIMPGMELGQAKIPYLPPDWTVARGVRYAAKLGVFILVPGLHQIACRRWIFGGLLMALFFAAEFTQTNIPFNYSDQDLSTYYLASNFSDISLYISWGLLTVDLRNIETRTMKLTLFLVLCCATGLYFVPAHYGGNLNIHIEQDDFACPMFCKYDIVEYEFRHLPKHNFSIGDYVITEVPLGNFHLSKVVAGPPGEACAKDDRTILRLPVDNFYCFNINGKYVFEYIVLLGPHPVINNREVNEFTMVNKIDIVGVELKKIGNTHEYFVLSDGVTDSIGKSLLTIYQLTGVNLFGLKS
jgi:hypothetical protein